MRRAALESSRIRSRARVDVCANAFSRASLLSNGTCVSARRSALRSVEEKKWGGTLSFNLRFEYKIPPREKKNKADGERRVEEHVFVIQIATQHHAEREYFY